MHSTQDEKIVTNDSFKTIKHITLVIGLICVGIGQTLLYTILGPASREIGISEFSVGLIVTTAALVIALSSGAWGHIIGRFGSRNAYLAGMLFYTIGTAILGYVLHISIEHKISMLCAFILLMAVRCITGFLTAGIHPAAMTYIAESTSAQERGAGIALIASAYGIGSIIGPALASAVGNISFLLPIYVAAAISLIGLFLGVLVLTPQEKNKELQRAKHRLIKLTDKRVLPVFISISLTYVAFSCFQQTLSFYIQDVFHLAPKQAVEKIGLTFSTMALCMIVTQLVFIRFIKPSFKIQLRLGTACCIAGFLILMPLNANVIFINFAAAFLGIGFGLMIPAIQSSASLAVTREEQSGVAGFLFGASAFGYVIGPAVGTLVYSHQPVLLFSLCALVIISSYFFASNIINRKQ